MPRKVRKKSTKATGRDYTYDKAYQKTAARRKYQAELHAYNRKIGNYGKKDGTDALHVNGKIVGLGDASKNRAKKTDFTIKSKKARTSKRGKR